MVSKYEILTNDEIINQYKLIKEKERTRNKEAYERLKQNKVKYRMRLNNAYNKQVERNKTDFQSKAGGVADCGRHSSLACLLLRHLTFRELEELYFTNNDTWLKGDHVATILTLLTLDDIGKYYINRGK